jgi:hypothetical protein
VTGWRIAKWWRVVSVIVLVAVGLGAPLAQAQDDDALRALYNMELWLKRDLGKPNLTLIDYTYQGSSWPDSSLGCAVPPGVTVEPGTVYGYRWSLLYDNMVRYEVHSNLDGTQVVLCSSANATPDVSLTPFVTTTFRILSPESWLAFPNAAQSVILFAPQQQLACSVPGMRVTVLGRVASGVTPDQLLDEYFAQAGIQDDPAARVTVGTFGRAALVTKPCDDGSQQWRVTAFVQYGSAYRVEQWADRAEFERWSPLFQSMLQQFGPPDAVAAPAGGDTPATSEPPADATPAATGEPAADSTATTTAPAELPGLPLAHVFVGDIFIGALNDIPGRSVTSVPTDARRALTFSPDGLLLAFSDVTNGQIRVLDAAESKSPRTVAEDIDATFAPVWSADSRQIAYVAALDDPAADGAGQREIRTIAASGGDPQPVATFAFEGGCTGPGSDPADRVFFEQTGPDTALVWLADGGFLVTTRCGGGLSRLNPADGTLSPLGDDLGCGALAPDGTRYAARSANGIALIDLVSGARSDLGGGPDVGVIAWAADGRAIFYGMATLSDSTTLDDAAQQTRGESVFGTWPVTIQAYDLALVRHDLAANTDVALWHGTGRGIGAIASAPDGSGLLFSLTPSGMVAAEAFRAGANTLDIRQAWPASALYWLPAGGTVPRVMAFSSQPVFAPVTVPAVLAE